MIASTIQNKNLCELLHTAAHSGLPELDQDILKEIKNICKQNSIFVEVAFTTLLRLLKKKHAEIRLSAFQVCIELFNKSKSFRLSMIKDMEIILELTAGIDSAKPLPPPKDVALKLRRLALSSINKWYKDYNGSCKELTLCYRYLEKKKNLRFASLMGEVEAAEASAKQHEEQVLRLKNEMLKTVQKAYEDIHAEIEASITSINNCLELLLPTPNDFFVSSESDLCDDIFSSNHVTDTADFELRHFGLTPNYNIEVVIPTDNVQVVRNSENSSIIDNLKENLTLIHKRYYPIIVKWLKVFKENSNDGSQTDFESLKEKLDDCVKKSRELKVKDLFENSDSEDDEFEEVTKEGFESHVIDPQPSCSKASSSGVLKNVESRTQARNNHFPSESVKNEIDAKTEKLDEGDSELKLGETSETFTGGEKSSDRKQRLLAIAPKLPYDIDLYHWEDANLKAPTLVSTKVDNPKFWSTAEELDEIPDPSGVARLRTRVMEFTGTFEPVKWSCRAPLPSGKLCPRMDRNKCPFHGRVVPRDENGKCVNPEDEKQTTTSCSTDSLDDPPEPVPDWQDPQLLAQIKEATGIDLTMPVRKKGKKGRTIGNKGNKAKKKSKLTILNDPSKNFPGVSKLPKEDDDSKLRLKKKLFNRSALKRMREAANRLEHKRHRDKFGDQFNYIFHTS